MYDKIHYKKKKINKQTKQNNNNKKHMHFAFGVVSLIAIVTHFCKRWGIQRTTLSLTVQFFSS